MQLSLLFRRFFILVASFSLVSTSSGDPPLWWNAAHASDPANPAVLDVAPVLNGNPPNNKGPANIGQAKHMARSAILALRAQGFGQIANDIENDLVGENRPIPSWDAPTNPAERDKQKAPLLIGQLKAIAHPFYSHLDAASSAWLADQRAENGTESGGIFPWTDATSDDKHHGMANIGQLKAVFSLHFTRDMDGDGLPDLTEYILGTNPSQAMTYPGIPDAWVAANFPPGQVFDPDDDPAGDGITNALKYRLGLDPHTHYVTGLVNPGFNEDVTGEPDLSFREEYPSDLYDQTSVPGWEAAGEEQYHIEIWDEDDGNPYVELQSDQQAHGVKQEFEMLPGSRLNFILRYKGRYEYLAYDNAFKLEVEGAEELLVNGSPAPDSGGTKSHDFMDDDSWDPGMVGGVFQENQNYGDWHYASVSITAPPGTSGLKPLTLTLTPLTTTTYNEDGEEEDITYGGFVDIIPVEVEDNEFATGVDAVSFRASSVDLGSQDKYWIMAPSGNDPNDSPCSNEMKFNIPADAATEMEIAYPDGAQAPATPTPGTVTLGAEGADCAWHGESPITTEDPAVVWKIGAPGQIKTAVDLPIAVKTMKRRTVRVAVWPVNLPAEQEIFPSVDARNEFEADLESVLNRIFAFQINAWFDVSVGLNKTFDYLDGTDPSPYTLAKGVKEKAMIDAYRNVGYDINVFLINNVLYTGDYTGPVLRHVLGSSYPQGFPGTEGRENCAVVNMSAYYTQSTSQKHTIAHEIGHLLVGPGHPDQYRDDDPESGGFAPLQSLPGEHRKRLMHSTSATGMLLVKREWDEAEMWLVRTLETPE